MKAIALAATVICLGVFIADPVSAFTPRSEKPPAGDCAVLVSKYGADNVWFGRYSGFMWRDVKREVPFANQGCFSSEAACRVWINENMTFTEGGSFRYATCEREVPARYR